MSVPRLDRDDYTIGWICALPVELKAVRALLDQQHQLPVQREGDNNSYTVGRIGVHNVVIAVLPAGRIGTNPAATIGSDMNFSFRNLRFGLMVGIGGGVPSSKHDIRLGDVVVSVPAGRYSGVVQYDQGKALANDLFEPTGFLNLPPPIVLNTVNTLRSLDHESLLKHLSKFDVISPRSGHPYPGLQQDQLYKAEYSHRYPTDDTCERCDVDNLVPRPMRDRYPFYHYGTIASGNLVIRDGVKRDKLQKEHGILCFEMEAAGLMNTFPCLVIRGICDYSDSHKNKCWQPYAAATAAAYAKFLLEHVPPNQQVREPDTLADEGPIRRRQKPCFMVPFDRDRNFIGRESLIQEIEQRFERQSRVALAGIGGVGKSQIVIEYCYRWHDQHPQGHVFWIHASTRESIEQACHDIAMKLNLPTWNNPNVNAFKLVSEWLSNDENGSWLLTLDNADDIETFFGTKSNSPSTGNEQIGPLANHLPRSSNGSTIITTRDKRVGERLASREKPINILPMDRSEAESLLWSKVPSDCTLDRTRSSELLELLGYLPLAITQAAAYICENSILVEDYLKAFQAADSEVQDLLSVDLPDHRRDFEMRSEMHNSVIQTWKVSFDQIRRQTPRAAEMLCLMAVLNRQGIPKMLLRRDVDHGTEFTTALGTLQAFSLVTAEKGGESFKIHRLVQVSTQSWLELHGETTKWKEEALEVLSEVFPSDDYKNWATCEVLSPHVQVVTQYAFTSDLNLLYAKLLYKVSSYDKTQGRYNLAYHRASDALSIREKELGPVHFDTLTSMHDLAVVLRWQGKYEAAEKMHRQELELSQKVLGPEHPETLTSMCSLAIVLRAQGKYEAAEKMHRQELELSQKVLGPEHPDTLWSTQYLATMLEGQGNYEESEKMHRQELELSQKVLGSEHPGTLASMTHLDSVLGKQCKLNEAEELLRQAFEAHGRVLGPNHLDTLFCGYHLGVILRQLKQYNEASGLFQKAHSGLQEAVGLDHLVVSDEYSALLEEMKQN